MDKRVEEAKDKFLEMIKNEDFPEAVARTFINNNGEEIPSCDWSLNNQLLMIAHGEKAAAGYKQWKKLGRHVEKGANAFHILAPVLKTVTVEEEIENKNGENETEEKEVRIPISYRSVPVFGYSDTDGEELEQLDFEPEDVPPLYDVAKHLDFNVEYNALSRENLGSYLEANKEIELHSEDVSVFFHELAHGIHYIVSDLEQTSGQDPFKEAVAETVSAILCILYDREEYAEPCYQYIKKYLKERGEDNILEGIMKITSEVDKILKFIMEAKENVEGDSELKFVA